MIPSLPLRVLTLLRSLSHQVVSSNAVTLLEALQLIGYSLGAMLPLWLGYLLAKQRLGMVPIQRLLIALALCMIGWHGGNLVITLRSLLGLPHAEWAPVLRLANTIAVISITA